MNKKNKHVSVDVSSAPIACDAVNAKGRTVRNTRSTRRGVEF